jgi:hypothetical protein
MLFQYYQLKVIEKDNCAKLLLNTFFLSNLKLNNFDIADHSATIAIQAPQMRQYQSYLIDK